MRTAFLILGCNLCFTGWTAVSAAGQQQQPPDEPPAETVVHERPGFFVRVDVDRADRTYRGGELLHATVVSERAGHLYLLYRDAEGRLSCVFPNRYQTNSAIPAGQAIRVPAEDAPFVLRVGPPFGRELLKALVTLEPVDPARFGVESLTDSVATPLQSQRVKGLFAELKEQPAQWTEHQVEVHTLAAAQERGAARPRRVAICVGVGAFQDPRIRPLPVSGHDAQAMAEALQAHGAMDEVILLVNEQATLAAIREAIAALVERTGPGDIVFVYWSGHGGRCADDDGDESDGYDEYLVAHDGRLDDLDTIRHTMLIDDTFGRWVQQLDGRRVVLILDTCHSAGQMAGQKGLGGADVAKPGAVFDFLDGELARLKDIEQKELAMLAGAQATQLAFMRREGDLSVMTHFLVELLRTADRPVSLHDAYEHVQKNVPAYVEAKFPGAEQTPVLVDSLSSPVYVRP